MDFLDDLIVQISGEGCITTWSTFPNFNNLLEIEEIGTPFIQVNALSCSRLHAVSKLANYCKYIFEIYYTIISSYCVACHFFFLLH